eukprot:CFRG5230T1
MVKIVMLVVAGISASVALSIVPRAEDGTSYIVNQYGYCLSSISKSDYIEWSNTDCNNDPNVVRISQWPAPGDTGPLITTEHEKCLQVIDTDTDIETSFPDFRVEKCDRYCNATQYMPGYGQHKNQIMVVADYGICGNYETGFERCSAEKGGDVCMNEDEGYVAVRPCAESYQTTMQDRDHNINYKS